LVFSSDQGWETPVYSGTFRGDQAPYIARDRLVFTTLFCFSWLVDLRPGKPVTVVVDRPEPWSVRDETAVVYRDAVAIDLKSFKCVRIAAVYATGDILSVFFQVKFTNRKRLLVAKLDATRFRIETDVALTCAEPSVSSVVGSALESNISVMLTKLCTEGSEVYIHRLFRKSTTDTIASMIRFMATVTRDKLANRK
jgi:hypothetical protein